MGELNNLGSSMRTQLLLLPLLLALGAVSLSWTDDALLSLKPGQEDKCSKCTKAPYLAKHGGFCAKCADAGIMGQADLSSCPRCRAGTKYYARNIQFCDTQCGDAKKKQTKKPAKKAIKKTTKKSRNNKKKYQEISVKAKSPVV